jgi:putative MATE family efflux protein
MIQPRLTEGPIGRHLFRMASPIAIGLLANMLMQVLDIWFISRLGAKPLAAMGFVFPVAMIFLSLSIGLSAGASSIIARKVPEGNQQGLRRLVTDTQSLSLLLSVVAAVIGWLTVDPLFRAMGASDNLLPLIHRYMDIFFFSSIVSMLGMSALSSMRAMGNAKLQGQAMLAGSAVNAVLDPILIFGLLGMPRLELQGAALASLAARMVSLAIAYRVLHGRMKMLVTPFEALPVLVRSWVAVLHVALPAVGTNIIIPVSTAIITAMLAGYGEDAVAGMGVAGRIEPVMLIAFYALSSVIGPFVGQNLGRGELSRVQRGVDLSSLFSLAVGFLLAISLWIFAKPLVALFSDHPEVIRVATVYLWIVPVSYGCAGVVMVISASFNGVGKPVPATVISVSRVVILYLPLAWLGSLLLGIPGIFAAYALVNLLCALLGHFWFRSYIASLRPS